MSERWEALGGGISLLTADACRPGEDALLLARFAAPQQADTVCDLGTGGGILPLWWCRRHPPAHIDAVEREDAFVRLAHASVAHNRLEERITVHRADWTALDAVLPAHTHTLVTCNPPYFRQTAGRESADPLRRAARQEDGEGALPDLFAAARRLLAENGRFCLCHRPERLTDVLCKLRDAQFAPRRLQFVQQTADAAPWLFLCEAVPLRTHSPDGSPPLRVLPPILTAPAAPPHTDVYKKLYK